MFGKKRKITIMCQQFVRFQNSALCKMEMKREWETHITPKHYFPSACRIPLPL